MTTSTSTPEIRLPHSDLGEPIEPAPYFHEWDTTPHAIFPMLPVSKVELGDVILGGTHQVEGIGRAEQRGTAAIRFDLEFIVSASLERTARIILPVDHLLEVKRYYPDLRGQLAWIKPDEGGADASLVVDHGSDVSSCDHAVTMCDSCVSHWESDYEVVRS